MRKIRLIELIIIGFTVFSCQSRFDLKSDKYLNEIFSKDEVKEIEKMISYVDDIVIENTDNKNINQAYHQFLDKINQTIQDSSRFLVPFEEEEKYEFLESLDSSIFNEFWYMGNHIRMSRYKDSIYKDLDNYKHLNLRPYGKYLDYLEKIGEDDEFYKSLKESLKVAGDLPASTAIWFPMNHKEFDFTIPKNRLWATIYILRIEEHHDKKMERYLKQKNSMHNVHISKRFQCGNQRRILASSFHSVLPDVNAHRNPLRNMHQTLAQI
ncbi:MAG: hypothetical protein PF436_07090 [Prolixibacteraceae bacterium]|jgi:hypothetical protein|nr:hypothetical protein [Prolixibacteraceae bacterium]